MTHKIHQNQGWMFCLILILHSQTNHAFPETRNTKSIGVLLNEDLSQFIFQRRPNTHLQVARLTWPRWRLTTRTLTPLQSLGQPHLAWLCPLLEMLPHPYQRRREGWALPYPLRGHQPFLLRRMCGGMYMYILGEPSSGYGGTGRLQIFNKLF